MVHVYKKLVQIRKNNAGKKIVYCSGTFDLTHAGHIIFFEDCKKLGDILVVGLGPDKDIKRNKNPMGPILNQHIRLKTISSLKPVDFCFVGTPFKNGQHKLADMKEIFKSLKPDIYVINEDAWLINERKSIARVYGVTLVILKRWCPFEFENISTSKIIEKIKTL